MGHAELAVERNGDEATLCVRGALDVRSGLALERMVGRAVTDGARRIVLDLGDCPLLDAPGIRTLIRVRRRADEARAILRIARCSTPAERMIARMHLEGILGMPSPDDDTPAFRPSSRFHRFAHRAQVHVWDGLLHRDGHTLGMSPEGMVVEVSGPLRPFQVLRIEMALPGLDTPFRFTGRVTRSRPGVPTFAEVEFLCVGPEMRLWLQRRTPRLAEPPPAPPRRPARG